MCEAKEEEYAFLDSLIDKSLHGIARIHDGLIVLEGCRAILRTDYTIMADKVKLVSGGKAEDELLYAGFVGPGMLTAAIFGTNFSAPSVDNILKVIEEVGFDRSCGIILIIQNHVEYTINFTLAKLLAEERKYNIKMIIVNNNDISYDCGSSISENDILPTLFIYKLAGAMSEQGRNVCEIYNLCNFVANKGAIVLLKTGFENVSQVACKLEMFSTLARKVGTPLRDVLNTSQTQNEESIDKTNIYCAGHKIAIIISNFGCGQIQANAFLLELLKEIETYGLYVERIYVKQFKKQINNTSFHVCILNLSLTTDLIEYLDFPTVAFAWPKMMTAKIIGLEGACARNLTKPGMYSTELDWYDKTPQGPIMNSEVSQTFLLIISMACEAIIACTKQLNTMDEQFGLANYGTNLACAAKAIQDAVRQNKILGTNFYVTFMQISQIIQNAMNGLRGGLYSLFFYNFAKGFLDYQNNMKITANMWLHALSIANKAMDEFEIFNAESQKMLNVLKVVQTNLEDAVDRDMDPIDAFGVAVRAAESFTTNVLFKKSRNEFKYPDPEAHAVGIWMRAAYEGTKFKLNVS